MLADGRRFSDRRVWHGYDGAQIEHWNEPITRGVKYAVVAHNTKTKPEAFPYRKTKREDGRDTAEAAAPEAQAELRAD